MALFKSSIEAKNLSPSGVRGALASSCGGLGLGVVHSCVGGIPTLQRRGGGTKTGSTAHA